MKHPHANRTPSRAAYLLPVLCAALVLLPAGILCLLYGGRVMEMIRAAVKLAVLS